VGDLECAAGAVLGGGVGVGGGIWWERGSALDVDVGGWEAD